MSGAAIAVSSFKLTKHPFRNWIEKKSSSHSVYFTKHFFLNTGVLFFPLCILKMNGTFGDLSIVNTFINSSLHNNSLQILDGKDTNNTAEKYDPVSTLILFLLYIYIVPNMHASYFFFFTKYCNIMLTL